MDPTNVAPWSSDWMWGLPLIAVTVIIHAFGLGFMDVRVAKILMATERSACQNGFL